MKWAFGLKPKVRTFFTPFPGFQVGSFARCPDRLITTFKNMYSGINNHRMRVVYIFSCDDFADEVRWKFPGPTMKNCDFSVLFKSFYFSAQSPLIWCTWSIVLQKSSVPSRKLPEMKTVNIFIYGPFSAFNRIRSVFQKFFFRVWN